MDRTSALHELLGTLELRVLHGAQHGARAPLAVGSACVLAVGANGEGADIVLRDEAGASARVRITASVPHALIEVLAGEIGVGNEVHSAGAQAIWPMHTPMRIGHSRVAFGRADEKEWFMAAPELAADKDAAPIASPLPVRRRAELWLASLGAGVVLASVGALWMAHVAAAPRAEPAGEPPLVLALRNSEFAQLQARPEPDGRIELRGRLATLADRQRLDAWLAARQFAATVHVQVDEGLARDVSDVFRVNGVAVQARVSGPGQVVAEAAERDAVRLAKAEEVVRRDVRGLAGLDVRNRAKPLPPASPPVPDDPNKRIASVVPGDPAYLVTADGARYFVGALLPSGHRITRIAGQHVTLERDGQPIDLNF
ncbi:MAG TPA: hypothetical protein VF169_21875 [Albitalea sp.]|uniref:SctD/MshK family protein n=1 Tax=Piscinibacter sp. TaxID=1903157 RepID=UPI002ED5BD52